jgi:hypothetical protein
MFDPAGRRIVYELVKQLLSLNMTPYELDDPLIPIEEVPCPVMSNITAYSTKSGMVRGVLFVNRPAE